MAITVNIYNHTARLFADGTCEATDTYKLMLCSAATFSAADTTLAGVSKTESTAGTGYTAGGQALANVSVSTITTNDAKFDADDVIWTAAGGSIQAAYAILYNDTEASDAPLAFINFGGTFTAVDTTDFIVVWNSSGIFTWTVS